jgi:succinate dehydrogenase/fumarate reductase flavoprotein subunit
LDFEGLTRNREKFLDPLKSESDVDPDRLVHEIQEILFPVDVLIIMSEPKLKKALDQVLEIKEQKLPKLKATDTRTLIKAKETQTMVLAAEMTLKATMMRKETRENIFYREDYPEPDNKNWLKWIIAEKGEDGEIVFSTENVPFDRYPFKPR